MEWILPVLVETRSVHQDILADRQAIAQAQAASQAFHEQLVGLAHSTEMGIHQLQQELLLASAIKSMLEESNPALQLHWPEFSQEDMRLARQVAGHASDHASAARAGPDGSAATGLLFTCKQGVLDDPTGLLASSTSSTRPSAGGAGMLHAVSTPCWAGAAARASLDTSRHDTARPSAVTEVQRTPLTATEAPLILSEAASTASPGPTTQSVIAVAPGEAAAAAHPLPPKVALKTAHCVPAAAAAAEYGGPHPAPAADAHAQPRVQAAGLDERARSRAHEQQRPRALPSDAPSREASAEASRALAPASARTPAPAAAAPAPAAVGTGQPPKEELR
jgi:hypothetical protein